MTQTGAICERGFTLIEIVITIGIVATTVAAGIGLSLASRSFGVAAAATEFDHLIDSARTISRELQGATVAFVPDAYGDGTEVRVYAGTANRSPILTTLPPLYTHAVIEEAESLGKAPFAFVVHVNGALGGHPGFRIGTNSNSTEIGCPAKGAFHFIIHVNGGSADRFIPCRTTLASTGPATLTTGPAATMAPNPTPCAASSCTPAALPTAPSSTPTCPPNYTTSPTGCTPTPPPQPGPHYHVTVSLASPTMTVGGTDTFTAQATLTNPNSVPPGTPSSIPVAIQQTTAAICTASPPGSQPSGTIFTISALSAGTCTVVVQADISGVAGASTNTATLTVSTVLLSAPTPMPESCDLVIIGKCYHRIIDQVAVLFDKYVAPETSCSDSICLYNDAISSIALGSPYTLRPPKPPTDSSHELLFRIDAIPNVLEGCLPYSSFALQPANIPINWMTAGASGPVDPPLGFGKPSTYLKVNHVVLAGAPLTFDESAPWTQGTTVYQMYEAVANREVGEPQTFTFSSPEITMQDAIEWFPDFPGCDVSGGSFPSAKYGIVQALISFEVFQAIP